MNRFKDAYRQATIDHLLGECCSLYHIIQQISYSVLEPATEPYTQNLNNFLLANMLHEFLAFEYELQGLYGFCV